jgi:hypothetical protein
VVTRDLLWELGSEDEACQKGAIEAMARLPWDARLPLLKQGLRHGKLRTAVACAWVLDWKYLTADEMDLKIELLIPHCRRLWDDLIPGLDALEEDGGYSPSSTGACSPSTSPSC